jgi:hypothetical protein
VVDAAVSQDAVRRYYDPANGQFISVDPAVDQTEQPYAYVKGNAVNSVDPLGLGCGVFSPWDCATAAGSAWTQGASDIGRAASNLRLPDYVSVSVVAGIPGTAFVVTGGFTVTRQGHVYVTGGGGIGGGYDLNVGAAWLNQGSAARACELDPFVSGFSTTASGDYPILGLVGPMAGVTWGHPGELRSSASATELGVGLGTPGASATGTYSYHLFNIPGW